jgi:ABC-type transport system substrate-binding protein
MATMISADLEAVGIPTQLRALPLAEYQRFVASGDQRLFTFGWIGVATTPDSYLAPLFLSDSDDNLTGYRSPSVDGLLGRARAADDPAQNAERWAVAEETVMDAAVVVPIAQFRTQVVVAPRVQGLEHAVNGTVDWAKVTLDP